MKILLIILFIVIVSLALFGIKYKFLNKKKPTVAEIRKIDTEPFTKNVLKYVNKKGVIEINKDSLDFGDIDGDTITKVKFLNFTKPLYKNRILRTKYKEGEELDINTFNLYVKIEKDQSLEVDYFVFANNKWSK